MFTHHRQGEVCTETWLLLGAPRTPRERCALPYDVVGSEHTTYFSALVLLALATCIRCGPAGRNPTAHAEKIYWPIREQDAYGCCGIWACLGSDPCALRLEGCRGSLGFLDVEKAKRVRDAKREGALLGVCVRRVERAAKSACRLGSIALVGGVVRGFGRWWLVGEGLECPFETPILITKTTTGCSVVRRFRSTASQGIVMAAEVRCGRCS